MPTHHNFEPKKKIAIKYYCVMDDYNLSKRVHAIFMINLRNKTSIISDYLVMLESEAHIKKI